MRCLVLSSVFVLLAACTNEYRGMKTVAGDGSCIEQFRPVFLAQLYKANVQITGKSLSGLLLFKKMPDSSTRVVFSTETGFKFFDFSFGVAENFKVYYVIPQLDKKIVLNALQNDFDLLLMRWSADAEKFAATMNQQLYAGFKNGSKIFYYVTDSSCTKYYRAELAGKRKKLVEITGFGIDNQVPDSVYLQHFNFNFNISLKKLAR
jgi:hypothetical protein